MWDIAIKRPVFTVMVIMALLVFGVIAYNRIGIDFFPKVEMPVATIMTIYPGADPETVEKEVSEKIEDAVSTIAGIDTLRSISVENVSQVILQFDLDVDVDTAVQDVRDKISRIVTELPSEIEAPKVEKLDFDAIPVMTLAVGGPDSIDKVTEFARRRIKEDLQQVIGVGSIDIIGGQEREIMVWVDPRKLDISGLAVNDVIQVLSASNLKIPGGKVKSSDTEFSVKVDGEFKSVAAIENLVIMEVAGRRIRVGDVARVEDGLEERESSSRLDGVRAVTMQIRKQSGTNVVEVANNINARLSEIKKTLPPGWKVITATDTTVFTKESIKHVQIDMLFGAFLAVIIIFFFLRNIRSTIIAAIAIPTSVIGSFTFMNYLGFTFNQLTLLGLSLSIGLLIDDAIVVLENVYRHIEDGKDPKEAASYGTGEIGLAVLAVTLSIVAVFVPVATMEGIIGRFFYQFGITVTIAVLLSLFVSFTLTPMLCSRFLTHEKPSDNRLNRMIGRLLDWIDAKYGIIVAWALRNRWKTAFMAVATFVSSLYLASFLPVEFQPEFDMGEFNVTVKMPTGTTLERTEEVAVKVAADISRYKDLVESTVTSIGSDAQRKQNLSKIYVKLINKSKRTITQAQFMERIREDFKAYKDALIAAEEINMIGESSGFRTAKIQFNVRGGDLNDLRKYTELIMDEMRKTPGFVDLDTTFEGGKPEIRVKVDRNRAASMGVMTYQIGSTVRSLVAGIESSKYKERGEDYIIRVRVEEQERANASQISHMKVRNNSGSLVDIANLAEVITTTGPTQIDRQARQRQITILGNTNETLALADAMNKVNEIARRVLPPEIITDYEGDVKIMKESFQHMLFALMLAIALIYMVLASQFNSFVHPITIMISLPLSLIGALGALFITGMSLSMISIIGIIMLMGLVTKNAILLVDYTNTLRYRDGLDRNEALRKAGPVRLRPILMTTAAMVFGMLPAALGTGQGSEMRAPMAICVIGGLITSMLLTLVVVPVVYTFMDDIGNNRLIKKLEAIFLPHKN